jgi:virginiamycin B lyase
MGGRPRHRTVSRALTLAVIAIVALAPAAALGAEPHELVEFPLADGAMPFGIAAGADGALWFTERGTDSVGRIAADGTLGPWTTLAPGSDPTAIATGPDGAVWFTEQGMDAIGRLAPDGALSEYPLPSDNAGPAGIAAGPDGAMWFTERGGHRIGRVDMSGTVSEYAIPSAFAGPMGIAAGPDGALWFTEQRGNRIGRITTEGDVTEWPLPAAGSLPSGIAAGPDGAMWFTLRATNEIGRITLTGEITSWPVPTANSDPTAITAGWDGAMWFTGADTDLIGRVALDGAITEFPLPTVSSSPFSITAGPDDAVWFTEGNAHAIGRLTVPSAPTDTTPPTIRIDTPAEGSIVISGSSFVAGFACDDEGGSGLATCVGSVPVGAPVDTAPGAHRFEVTASDVAGNTASAESSYLAFTHIEGSIADGSSRAGRWATLELGFGSRAPTRAAGVVAAGFPVTQRVDCADPTTALGPASAAEVRVSTRRDLLVTRWRTPPEWAGTCRTITLRFAAPGWEGVDATFVVAFDDDPGTPHAGTGPCPGSWRGLWQWLSAWVTHLVSDRAAAKG